MRRLRDPQAPQRQGLAGEEPRVHLHFTFSTGSWLKVVENLFGITTRQAIRRGIFHSDVDLEAAIATYIDGWSECLHPFPWTKRRDHHAR